jgi:ferrous iron transport protein A
MVALADLLTGQRARVDFVDGDDALTQRLMEMGVLGGEVIEVIALAPLGDPMEVRVSGYRLSVRRREAARVQVTLL